jgi:outer membrane receptor protein involved in Fe transport
MRDLNRDGYEVSRYYTFGGSVSYALPAASFIGNMRITLGVDNILNRQPPIDFSGGAVGYNQSLVGRPGGRFGFMAVRKSY